MRKRTHEIKIRFTRQELAALNEKANRTRYSREGYCREILNGSQVKEAPTMDVAMMLRQLRNIACELNQIHREVDTSKFIDAGTLEAVLAQIRTAADTVISAYATEQRGKR